MTKIGAGESLIKILIKFLVDSTVWVSVVNALSNHLRLLFIVVMVKCINKNTKRKTLYPVKQIGETKKRNNSYFYPDETILLKQQIFHMIRYLPVCVSCPTLTRE
jgi:DNA gyrase subunit B